VPYTDTGLPFAAGSHESHQAAVKASATRATKTAAYLRLLARGPLTDDEVARRTGWPRSSICSIRGAVMACGLVQRGFTTRVSQFGVACRTWTLTAAGRKVVATQEGR
jgi:DNA-binding IclR family transcriptional regulator